MQRTSLLLPLCLWACSAQSSVPGGPLPQEDPPAITYAKDVKPLIDAYCTGCHTAGGAGPFPLTTLDEVRFAAPAVKVAVASRRMPPWPAAEGCTNYDFDRSLSDQQIATITDWIDDGAPELESPVSAPPIDLALAVLDRVDLHVGMAEPHTPVPPTGEVDEHRCFVIDWPETRDRYIVGFEAHPGNKAVVHHFVGTIIPVDGVQALLDADRNDPLPGYACGAGSGMSGGARGGAGAGGTLFDRNQGRGLFGVRVPGAGATIMPTGTGLLVHPGSKLLLNMHYNTLSGSTEPDQTTLDFMLADTVTTPGIYTFFTNPAWVAGNGMLIPAGAEASFDWGIDLATIGNGREPVTVHNAGMHAHTRAMTAGLSVSKAAGESCLLDIQKWDFNWQLGYRMADPVVMMPGDKLNVHCGFDNSRGTTDVTWGENTADEMCLGMVYLTR